MRPRALKLIETIALYKDSLLPEAQDEKAIFDRLTKAYLGERSFFNDKILSTSKDDKTILMHAIASGNPHVVRWVLTKVNERGRDNDPNMNFVDKKNWLALDLAIHELPEEKGVVAAAPSAPALSSSSVSKAATQVAEDKHPQLEIMEMMLKKLDGKGARALTNIDNSLKFAASEGKLAAVKLLIEHGADGSKSTENRYIPGSYEYDGYKTDYIEAHHKDVPVPTALGKALERHHLHVAEYLSQIKYTLAESDIFSFIECLKIDKDPNAERILFSIWAKIEDVRTLNKAYLDLASFPDLLKKCLEHERTITNPKRNKIADQLLREWLRYAQGKKNGFFHLRKVQGVFEEYFKPLEEKSPNHAASQDRPHQKRVELEQPSETNPAYPAMFAGPEHLPGYKQPEDKIEQAKKITVAAKVIPVTPDPEPEHEPQIEGQPQSDFARLSQESEEAEMQLQIALAKSKAADLALFNLCSQSLLKHSGEEKHPEQEKILATLKTLQQKGTIDPELKANITKLCENFSDPNDHEPGASPSQRSSPTYLRQKTEHSMTLFSSGNPSSSDEGEHKSDNVVRQP